MTFISSHSILDRRVCPQFLSHHGIKVSCSPSNFVVRLIRCVSSARLSNPAPLDYATPAFPGLYWPYKAAPGVAKYLYYSKDIWRYTLLWTLIIFGTFHLVVAAFAVAMQLGKGKSAWKYVWFIPLVYVLIAGVEALLAGSFVGLM